MIHTGLPATTHTIEMTQIADINRRLANSRSPIITAAELGMAGAEGSGGTTATIAGSAPLIRLSWEGSPEFPLVHGHFKAEAPEASIPTDLHTKALQQISHRLHLQQRWGI